MEWSEENILFLIELYRKHELLWNSKHLLYYNKIKKHDAWTNIAEELDTTVDECKRKITNVLSSLRRERAKIKKSTGTGKGGFI